MRRRLLDNPRSAYLVSSELMKRARDIGSPTLLLVAALAAIAAGVSCDAGMRSCTQGTLLLTVTFGGTTRDANQLSIDVSIDNGAPETSTRSRAAGAPGGRSRSISQTAIRWASPSTCASRR